MHMCGVSMWVHARMGGLPWVPYVSLNHDRPPAVKLCKQCRHRLIADVPALMAALGAKFTKAKLVYRTTKDDASICQQVAWFSGADPERGERSPDGRVRVVSERICGDSLCRERTACVVGGARGVVLPVPFTRPPPDPVC